MPEWRAIPGFDGYEVSDDGRVRSWRSLSGSGMALEPHELKQSPFAGKKYLRVGIVSPSGKVKTVRVHLLVLETFVGPCPEGMEGCHNNGDPTDNSLLNLRWDTKKANAQDRIKHGNQVRGEKVHRARLTEEQAAEIREKISTWSFGDGRKFAKRFGVSDYVVSCVKTGRTWKSDESHKSCSV